MRFANPKPEWVVHRLTFVAALMLGGFWAGCVNQTSPSPSPAMPSVGPARDAPVSEISAEEIFKRVMAAAETEEGANAVEMLQNIHDSEERRRITLQLVTELSARNPKPAADVALALPPGPVRASALEKAAASWTQRDPEGALNWAVNLNSTEVGLIARRAVAETLAQNDANGAIATIKQSLSGNVRDEMVRYAAGIWVQRDPDAAIMWLENQPADTSRERLRVTMAFDLAQTKPLRALEMADAVPEGSERWIIYSQIGQTWAAVDRDAAMRWTNRLENVDGREAMLAGINAGLGATESRRVRSLPVLTSLPRGRAAYAISEQTDPAVFSEWLSTRSALPNRADAILAFVRERAALDNGVIGNWLANLDGEAVKPRALEIYFREILRSSPSVAASWVNSLPPAYRNDDMLEQAARALGKTNPAQVETLIRNMSLARFQQDQLIRDILR